LNEDSRLAALLDAEDKAMALFDAIETARLIAPGRSERTIEQEIYALAERDFGVTKHWHKRIVRSGVNALCTAGDNPPVREIGEDDLVFIDLGPVFGEWEADVGRTYVVGQDPEKRRLCQDLPRIFYDLQRYFDEHPDVTGAELYAVAHRTAEAAGWLFGARSRAIWSVNFRTPGFRATRISIGSARPTRPGCGIRMIWGRRNTGSSRSIWSTGHEPSAASTSDFWYRHHRSTDSRTRSSAHPRMLRASLCALVTSWVHTPLCRAGASTGKSLSTGV
jgi:Xaa-Pro aminopeptidase